MSLSNAMKAYGTSKNIFVPPVQCFVLLFILSYIFRHFCFTFFPLILPLLLSCNAMRCSCGMQGTDSQRARSNATSCEGGDMPRVNVRSW
jgi:hypothetical protein